MDIHQLAKGNHNALQWAKDWASDPFTSTKGKIKMISDVRTKMKNFYCTNGLWNPDAKVAYQVLLKIEKEIEEGINENRYYIRQF